VAIPALNEERTVADVIRAIPGEIPGIDRIEVVVIDDGSTDRTAALAAVEGARVISHPVPGGVGAAFHTALDHGIERGADLIVTIDADGQFDPSTIPELIRPVLDGEADFATASRFACSELTPPMPRLKLWGNRLMSRLISSLAGQRFYDVSCGMRCYSSRAALHLHLIGWFTYTQEVFLNLAFKRLRIVEVPLRVRGERAAGRSRVASNLWRYGIRTARIIFRSYRDYYPMRLFGWLAGAFLVPALVLGGFLLTHYLSTGAFTPHKWAGFTAAVLVTISLWMLHMGVTGDMLNRHRIYLEELLARQRRLTWGAEHADRCAGPHLASPKQEPPGP
jgi:glycosyltransferase involved in cell wall biosynthesis